MESLPFEPECYFCGEEPVMGVTFKSGDDGFLCTEHWERAQGLDQLTEARLVQTGIDRILKTYNLDWNA